MNQNQCIMGMLYFDLRPGPKMLFQGDTPEGSDAFQCATTVMHRKRVTSELHDSYFRLMPIKHSISKIQWAIVWALNYHLTQLSSGWQAVASRIPDSQRPDVVGKATPDRGGSRKAPME